MEVKNEVKIERNPGPLSGFPGRTALILGGMNRRNFGTLFSTKALIWLLLLLVLIFNFSIRWRLRDMPLERDEGEYAYAGQLLLQGIPPYELAYNMKLPGTYFAYAAGMAVFGQTVAGIHATLIVVNAFTIIFVFLLGRKLFGATAGLVSCAAFGVFSLSPLVFGLAAHA